MSNIRLTIDIKGISNKFAVIGIVGFMLSWIPVILAPASRILPLLPLMSTLCLLVSHLALCGWRRRLLEVVANKELSQIGIFIDALQEEQWAKSRWCPQSIGSLSNTPDWSAMVDMTIELLPKTNETHFHRLSARQKSILYKTLQSQDSWLVLSILDVLKNTHDSNSIPYIRKLAKGEWKAATDAEVRKQAQDCLKAIKTPIRAQNTPETLLRASSISTVVSEELVRPAFGNQEADVQSLLRASGGTSGTTATQISGEAVETNQVGSRNDDTS